MANINRDYLIVLDAKSSVITEADNLMYYIVDEHSPNLFVNLVVRDTTKLNQYVEVHDPANYKLELHIVKPNNDIVNPPLQGTLLSADDAIYSFVLPKEATDYIGSYKCELRVIYQETEETTITTSNKFKYRVKKSIYNNLDGIVDAPEYPLVIQLFDKLSDINQYEEDRRANELARQLAEQQRQTRFNALDADMTDSIEAIDNKVVEVEDRITTKEQAVDKLIVDTKADIDNYKEAKDQEIDDYKTAKDTEINNAIAAQDNKINTAITTQNDTITQAIANQDTKIDTAITAQNDKIEAVQNNDSVQNNKLDTLQNKATIHEERITATEVKNTEQDNRLDIIENTNTQQNIRLDAIVDKNIEQDSRLDAIEAIDVAQNTRLDNIEVKNQQQDERLLDIEKVNKRQDMNLKCLFAESKNNMIDITEEGNSIYLQNSTIGYTLIDEIKGNTLVNCNKEPNKELILNGNINTSGDNTVTLTEGVDGGLVDVALEGNTLVNVSKTKDSTAISIAYTVENSGNHISLQGDVDGNCRPVITGNTLWVDNATEEVLTAFDETKNLRLQSTFEDNLVTQEMVDSGEEVGNLGKYKVDYKSTQADDTVGSTKTLYLNSPLLEGDTIEEKDDGIYHVHRSNSVTFDGSDDEGWYSINTQNVNYIFAESIIKSEIKGTTNQNRLMSNNFVGNTDIYKNRQRGIFLNDSGEIRLCLGEVGDVQYLEQWLQQNPTTVVYELASPTYELIEQSNLVIPSYANGHLDFNTAVPVEKVDFLPFSEELTYLYANTQYTIQFISTKAITADIYLGGTELLAQSIVKGLNRITITTPSELADNKLIISGVGANISEVVVTDTDREFMYFEGMKSVGECEGNKIEILSRNKNLLNENTINELIPCHIKGNTTIKVICFPDSSDVTFGMSVSYYDKNKNRIDWWSLNDDESTDYKSRTFKLLEDTYYFMIYADVESLAYNLMITTDTTATSYVPYASNKKQILLNEPLRSTGDVKDRYVLIDGKWYIERNCAEVLLDGTNHTINQRDTEITTKKRWMIYQDPSIKDVDEHNITIINNKYRSIMANTSRLALEDGISQNSVGNAIHIYLERYSDGSNVSKQALISELQQNPVTIVYQLAQPVYEPINYNPLEVYSDVTHITTNSTIPCNIIVKNHGFNCLLKPSTTYTVSSNLGLNTVTTPSTLTEDCLRFMDTDTSDITTMKDVLVLEGDWTTKVDLIPANFSGIESAFEQEYNAEKGKYKVNVKVTNEDKTKENNITFYINEPLRGTGDVKDKVYVKDDKVVVERNCGIRAYEDRDFGTYPTDKVNTVYPLAEPIYEEVEYNDVKLFIESFKNSTLFYNSNVAVTSKLYYSYSVPIVDTVAALSAQADKQEATYISILDEEVNK